MADKGFVYLPDIVGMVNIVPNGILSRTVSRTDKVTAVVFSFGAGQELSEHTSSKEAVLHFLRGEATVTLGKAAEGGETTAAKAGTVIRMRPGLPHSVYADTDTLMLLSMMG